MIVLALGIGANTAIFSVVNTVLLRALPFPNRNSWCNFGIPTETLAISRRFPIRTSGISALRIILFLIWRRSSHAASFSPALETRRTFRESCLKQPFATAWRAAYSWQVFSTEEDNPHANGGMDSVIISYRLWRERFGGDPHILGRVLKLDGNPFFVVGVMPAHFDSYTGGATPDLWITAAVIAEPSPTAAKPVSEERGTSFLNVMARLRPDVSLKEAQADMTRSQRC